MLVFRAHSLVPTKNQSFAAEPVGPLTSKQYEILHPLSKVTTHGDDGEPGDGFREAAREERGQRDVTNAEAPRSNDMPLQSGVHSDGSSGRRHPAPEIRRSASAGDFYFQLRVGETILRFHSSEPDFSAASLQILNPAEDSASDVLDGLSLFLERMRRNGVEEISLNGRPLTLRGLA